MLIPAESTPLGVPLILLTGVRTHVGLPAMLQRVGYFDASSRVNEVMAAAREGRLPQGVQVGPPVDDQDDERIEYMPAVDDLLADFAPNRWAGEPSDSARSSMCGRAPTKPGAPN